MALAASIDGLAKGVTLSDDAVVTAALALDGAARTHVQIPLLSEDHPAMTLDDAYAIQSAWVKLQQANGDPVVGWKIGLTSKAMQAALSIDIPDSGVLLRSMVFEDGAEIPPGRFIQPRIEAEIAFVMKTPLDNADPSPDEILAATEYIAPALEILDTRVTRKDPRTGQARRVFDTIADNAANGGIVLGAPVRDIGAHDLRWIGAIVSRNDEVEETGLGAGVLNDPLLSVSWLVTRLAAYGARIEPGQIILSGSFIRPVEAPPGSRIVGDFGNFGRVSCHFTA
ncbi:2-oxo-hepta-3-ene-1,7-dioate hydratase [Sphingomonas sp. Root710]|uniref:2-oxo-hept-4-ene-1,7-dioate hydratase n=1 Tax=Sphingomonas sp. Root710 TaxID=1736594 RepID=UPI0006FC0BBA|nr:2-oxo-hepta-3-ene-1,7-dioic acid hydratase [Sphingomonas sp. Root710]KRB78868.1 2-oxo-hepta-3-ene-1,7-dioate hydratase [Sphingomonas sp. Root710]